MRVPLLLALALPQLAAADTVLDHLPREFDASTYILDVHADPDDPLPEPIATVDARGRGFDRPYRLAPDRRTIVIHRADTLEILQGDLRGAADLPTPERRRTLRFSACGRYLSLDQDGAHDTPWVLDLLDPTRPRPCATVFPEGPQLLTRWDPHEPVLYRLQDLDGHQRLLRYDLRERVPEVVFHAQHQPAPFPTIYDVRPIPGPSQTLLFFTKQGLYTHPSHPTDAAPQLLDTELTALIPRSRLFDNVELTPTADGVALLLPLGRQILNAQEFATRGLQLAEWSLPTGSCRREQLSPSQWVHTIWHAPNDRRVLWASTEDVCVQAPGEEPMAFTPIDEDGERLRVCGAQWSPDGAQVAFTAGARLGLLDTHDGRVRWLARFPEGFAMEPNWLDDERVIVTQIVDTEEGCTLRRSRPVLEAIKPPK